MYSGDYNTEYAMSGEEFNSFRRRRSPGVVAFWTSLFVSIGTFLLLHFVALPAFQVSSQKIVVPQLSGLGIAQAVKVLGAMGLRLERMARQADQKPAGTILSHVPLPGRRVSPNTSIRVIVSLGPTNPSRSMTRKAPRTNNEPSPTDDAKARKRPTPNRTATTARPKQAKGFVRIPRLTSMSLSRAKRVLRRMGLRLRHISFGADEDKSPHWVLGQKPRPYTRVKRGSPVDLTINRDDL